MQQKKSVAAQELAKDMQAACLGVRVGRLQRLVSRQFDQALRPFGLSISQMEVLSALTLTGRSLRPSDLATGLNIERSTMSRNLSLMEKHGLIETTATSPTGRSTRFDITDHGRQALAGATDAWRETQNSLTSKLGDGAASTLDGWIRELNTPDGATSE